MTTTIIDKLNRLDEMQCQEQVIRMKYEELRQQARQQLPLEVKAMLDKIQAEISEINAEEATSIEALTKGIASLTDEIKADVVNNGESVKGSHLHAVYAKGRESWDGKSLAGYSAAHPEILAFRKVGEPSVSIRAVK